jgi:diadenosine tetraphosphate (Ap4A) HIT family hydrolase
LKGTSIVAESTSGCLFCDLAAGAVEPVGVPIYADDLVTASHVYDYATASEDTPTYLGNIYAQTRRHVRSLAEMSDAEARAMGLLLARLSRAVKGCTGAEHVYAEFYAEVVPHVHFLVVARYAGTPRAFWRWRVTEWPDAPRGARADVAVLASKLREVIAQEAASAAPVAATDSPS